MPPTCARSADPRVRRAQRVLSRGVQRPTWGGLPRRAASAALLAFAAFGFLLPPPAEAQVCGDVNADQQVTVADAYRVLKAAVGQDVALVCTDQCAALEQRVAALELLLSHLSVDGDNLVLTGQNLQVVSGAGATDATPNGTGNLVLGYNETNSTKDKRSGSHNLVVGRHHSYSSYGAIVAGEDNESTARLASVLGGSRNKATGPGAVVVSGLDNEARSEAASVLAGERNLAAGRSCAVGGGAQNTCSGTVSVVGGGSSNTCSGTASVLGGGSSRTLGSNYGWMAGSLGPVY